MSSPISPIYGPRGFTRPKINLPSDPSHPKKFYFPVNNVGMSYEFPERFERVHGGIRRVADMTVFFLNLIFFLKIPKFKLINTFPTTILSHHILQQMAKRNRGVVVNVASSAANFDWFYLAVYSATKVFLDFF